jgi:aromatic ring hydroxylase
VALVMANLDETTSVNTGNLPVNNNGCDKHRGRLFGLMWKLILASFGILSTLIYIVYASGLTTSEKVQKIDKKQGQIEVKVDMVLTEQKTMKKDIIEEIRKAK